MSVAPSVDAAVARPEVRALRAAIDALASLDAAALASTELVTDLAREVARLDAVQCRQAAAFDVHGAWAAEAAQTSPAWVATRTRVDRRVAERRLRMGRALRAMDVVADAFAAGTITIDHVDVLARARGRSRVTALAFGNDEPMLVGWATSDRFDRFRRRVDEWAQAADEAEAERRAARRFEQRRLHLSQSFEDQWFLDAVLDPVGGQIVHDALDHLERAMFRADWAAAKAELGRDPAVAELPRTAAQRRADALVEMARRAATAPAGGRAPRPLFTVLVGEAGFAQVCRLAAGTVIAPGSLVRWLDDAVIERITFDGPARVLGVSRRRSFEGALRRAIEVRDGGCTADHCDRPAEHSQVDHIVPWAAGGRTELENGRLRCGFHNRRGTRRPRPPDPPP